MNNLHRSIELLTGARKGEVMRTLGCFLALFLLLTSYYLIKPLRSSYLYREFDPDSLRYLFLFIPIISLIVTRIFNWFYERTPKFRLIFLTYLVIIVCKILFLFLLPIGGKAFTLAFYFWATVYFLLAISVLWSTISTIFNSASGERVFAFISFGAVAGALVGSKASEWLAHSVFKDQALLASAVMMGAVLASLFLALKSSHDYLDDAPQKHSSPSKPPRVLQDFAALWQLPYVRAIAIMVFALAFMNTMLEFKSQKIIDHKQAEVAYLNHFSSLNTELCRQTICERQIHTDAFNEVLNLRTIQKEQRIVHLSAWIKARHLRLSATDLDKTYAAFQTELESLTRAYLSEINFWTNLLGVVLLLVFARPLFHYLGIRQILVQLPTCFLVIGVMLFFPMELSLMGLILIGSGTLNYSLNKTAKELLYTQADDTARFRYKPLIDGPVMRFGDVFAAALSILCLDALRLPENLADSVLIIVGMGLSLGWFISSWRVGQEYEALKSKQSGEALVLAD